MSNDTRVQASPRHSRKIRHEETKATFSANTLFGSAQSTCHSRQERSRYVCGYMSAAATKRTSWPLRPGPVSRLQSGFHGPHRTGKPNHDASSESLEIAEMLRLAIGSPPRRRGNANPFLFFDTICRARTQDRQNAVRQLGKGERT